MKMTMIQEGKFEVFKPVDSAYMCEPHGEGDNPYEYHYKVTIKGENIRIGEPDYFIVNSQVINDYFVDAYSGPNPFHMVSCELIAARAVDYFKRIFNEVYKDVNPDSVEVCISPVNGRHFIAEWSWR